MSVAQTAVGGMGEAPMFRDRTSRTTGRIAARTNATVVFLSRRPRMALENAAEGAEKAFGPADVLEDLVPDPDQVAGRGAGRIEKAGEMQRCDQDQGGGPPVPEAGRIL